MQATWAQGSAVDKFQRTARMFELSGASDLAKQGADAALVQSLKVLHTSHPDIADRVIAVAQEELKQQLVRDLAPGGAFLVQLTESFDKRFSEEEIDALIAADVDFEVVPGITAALAASAELRQPLTQRARSRHFVMVTPKQADDSPPNDWARPIVDADAAVA